jgi:hypothetical protein
VLGDAQPRGRIRLKRPNISPKKFRFPVVPPSAKTGMFILHDRFPSATFVDILC